MAVPIRNVYLDYNASSPVLPEVLDTVALALKTRGNPSSVHTDGRGARALVEEARESIGSLIGARAQSITFVSGGTEANASVIGGFKASNLSCSVLGTSIEHPSVLAHISQENRVPADAKGLIDLSALNEVLEAQSSPFLFCLMLANNETGAVQPVSEVSEMVHKYGGLVLCDAVQGLAKLALDVSALGADFYTFSAHKIGGPQGVGCVVSPKQIEFAPSLPGGGQERGKRSGTENVSGIAGFGAAARYAQSQGDSYRGTEMRDRLEAALLEARPEAVIVAQESLRLPNTTNVAIPGVPSERQIIKLDLAGFSVSAGSACSSGKVEPSHVLVAMGLVPEICESAIRISTGPQTEWGELERFVSAWAVL